MLGGSFFLKTMHLLYLVGIHTIILVLLKPTVERRSNKSNVISGEAAPEFVRRANLWFNGLSRSISLSMRSTYFCLYPVYLGTELTLPYRYLKPTHLPNYRRHCATKLAPSVGVCVDGDRSSEGGKAHVACQPFSLPLPFPSIHPDERVPISHHHRSSSSSPSPGMEIAQVDGRCGFALDILAIFHCHGWQNQLGNK